MIFLFLIKIVVNKIYFNEFKKMKKLKSVIICD